MYLSMISNKIANKMKKIYAKLFFFWLKKGGGGATIRGNRVGGPLSVYGSAMLTIMIFHFSPFAY